ncbi:MAG: LacI family DNA-binding transcriptional regulator [Eubacteriales bacterium]|jgi:LacI family transcriptional regulator
MAATIRDIAEKAGCGVATVSSYLNGGNVRPANRTRIESAIEELHYTVNETARMLKTDRTRMIGAVIPELDSTFCAQVLSEIEDVLRKHGYAMLVCDCRSDAGREKEAVDFLMNRRVDGLFVIPADSSGEDLVDFQKSGKPLVLIDRQIDSVECSSVCVDNRRAIHSAVDLLTAKGHRKIGMIAGPQTNNAARQRLRGFEQACEDHGIPAEDRFVYYGDDSIRSGTEGLRTLLEQSPDTTAVIASNYQMTMGVVIGVNEMGISVPERLSLIGFDNPQFARAVHPKLTIVSQPVQAIGERAAEIMLRKLDRDANGTGPGTPGISGGRDVAEHIWLETEIIEGHSVKTLP